MAVSLRTLLLVPLILQVLGITSLIGYFSHRTGQQAVQGRPAFWMVRFEPFEDVQGQVQGAFGAAFFLAQISQFLKTLDIAHKGHIFIVDSQGGLVATSASEGILNRNPDQDIQPGLILDPRLWQLRADESHSSITRAAATWATARSESAGPGEPDLAYVNVNGERYFAYRLPLTLTSQPDWTVVMAIPNSEFKAAIYKNNRRPLLLCSLGLVGSLGFGLWILRRLARPLEQLSQTIQNYAAEGTFQPPRVSGIQDLDCLGKTLEQMIISLEVQKRQVAELHANYTQALQAQVNDKTQELQALTAKLQEAQRIAQMGSWEMDVATGEVVLSGALLTLLKPALLQGHAYYPEILNIVPEQDRALLQETLEVGIKAGLVRETEIRIPRTDGSTLYLVSRGEAVYNSQGEVIRLVGTATDITDRKLAEIALKESETRLRQALEISGAVVWEHDLESHELFFSSTVLTDAPMHMPYEKAIAMVHPDDQSLVRQANQDAVAERGSYDIEHRVVDPNSPFAWRWFQVNAKVLTDDWNHPTKIVGMSVDISDRKRAELALRESEAQFATVFRDNPSPAWITRLEDGQVLDVNRSFCAFLGCSAREVVGYPCTDLALWDNPDDCEHLHQLLKQSKIQRNYQTSWRTSHGELRTVLLSTRVVSFQGQPCVIGIINDITDRQETETMLRQLSQQLLTWRDRYEVAIWAGRQIIYEYDVLADCYTWGRNTQDILGYDLEEMPQTLEECVGFVHPTQQQAFLDLMANSGNESEPFKLEFRLLKQDGTYLWMEDQGVPQVDDQGQFVKVIGALKDISERKQSEAERAYMIDLLKQSEANYLDILQHQTELVTRFTSDRILLFVNDAFCNYYGVSWDQVVGKKFYHSIHPEDQPLVDHCLASLSLDHPVGTVQHRAVVQGNIRWMEWTNKAIFDAEGNLVEFQSVGRDIHDRRQTEIALQESRAKFQRLVDDIGDKFVVFSRTGDTGIVTYVSDGIQAVFGLSKATIIGQPWDEIIAWDPEDIPGMETPVDSRRPQGLDVHQFDRGFTHPTGEKRMVNISQHLVKDAEGHLVAIEGIVEDITDRKHSEQELKALNARLQSLNHRLEELATQDSLTLVANRRKMEQVLALEWHRCQREDQPLALILLDIDFFKLYNDHYGHPQGDWCLQQVAQVLQSCMKRPGDLVARYGGEEFLLILPNTNVEGARSIACSIQFGLASLAIPHAYSAVSDKVTVSLGIAVVITIAPDLSCSEAVALADQALYQAKQNRNTFHVEVMS